MAISKLETNLDIISRLDNEPNDVGGMTAEALKAEFDKAGNLVKEYINNTLIPGIEEEDKRIEGDIANLDADKAGRDELQSLVLGQIPNGSVTSEKLADGSVTSEKLADGAIPPFYTKPQTLTDATKALYGKGADAVPDDVFRAVHDEAVPKIGDIKYSVRTDLGDKWLLCNGARITLSAYPELCELFPWSGVSIKTIAPGISGTKNAMHELTYHNGLWVGAGYGGGSSYYYPMVWVGASLGTWTETKLNGYDYALSSICAYDGRWIAVQNRESTSYLYIATDPASNTASAWAEVALPYSDIHVTKIKCFNGMWVCVGYNQSDNSNPYQPFVLYTETPSVASSWKQVILSTTVKIWACDIEYSNGTWVVAGYKYTGSTSSSYYPYIFVSDDLGGSWTAKQLATTQFMIQTILCHNGVWVTSGSVYSSSSSSQTPVFFVTKDPYGTWTTNTSVNGDTYSYSAGDGLAYHEGTGTWIAVGGGTNNYSARFYTATDPFGTWEAEPAYGSSAGFVGMGICVHEDEIVSCGYLYNSGDFKAMLTGLRKYIPTITSDASYAYIKAKE